MRRLVGQRRFAPHTKRILAALTVAALLGVVLPAQADELSAEDVSEAQASTQETTEVAVQHGRQSASTGPRLRGPDRARIATAFPFRRGGPIVGA